MVSTVYEGKEGNVFKVFSVVIACYDYLKDECSFVSLRDVERAMIVFRHFCIGQKCFHELVDEMAERKVS